MLRILLCSIVTAVLALPASAAEPAVKVSTLNGDTLEGMLTLLSPAQIKLQTAEGEQTIAVEEVLKIAFPSAAQPANPDKPEAVLLDGSRLTCEQVTTEKNQITLKTLYLGELTLPTEEIKSIRFAPQNLKLEPNWKEMHARETAKDMLVIARKGDVLDFIQGFVGEIDEDSLKFFLDDNELPVKKEKLYGLIYSRKPGKYTPACQVTMVAGNSLQAQGVAWKDDKLIATTLHGEEVAISADSIHSLDYSEVKIQLLSEMEWRRIEYNPIFPDPVDEFLMQVRKDQNQAGKPLEVHNQTFGKGLWLHSKTTVQYNLAGEYRRFRTVAGIEQSIAAKGAGDVDLIIKGDGKELYRARIKGTDLGPQIIDLDVSNVLALEIVVDYGEKQPLALAAIGDHLVLGDAKLIK